MRKTMTEIEDELLLDKIYGIMEEWINDLKPIKKPRIYLDSIWKLIKNWYYSRPFYDVTEFYEEDNDKL